MDGVNDSVEVETSERPSRSLTPRLCTIKGHEKVLRTGYIRQSSYVNNKIQQFKAPLNNT